MDSKIARTGLILIFATVGCGAVRVPEEKKAPAWIRDDRLCAFELRAVRPDAEFLFEQILPSRLEELGKKPASPAQPEGEEFRALQELLTFWSGFRFLDRILHGDLTTAEEVDRQRRHGISVRRATVDEALMVSLDGRIVPSGCAVFVGRDALVVSGATGQPFEVSGLLNEREQALKQIEEVAGNFSRAVEDGLTAVRN